MYVLRIFLMGSSVLKWPSIVVRMNTKAIKKGKGYTFRLHRYKCNETRPGSISRQFENVSLIWMSGFLEWKEKIYAKAALALLCCMVMVIIMRMRVNQTNNYLDVHTKLFLKMVFFQILKFQVKFFTDFYKFLYKFFS